MTLPTPPTSPTGTFHWTGRAFLLLLAGTALAVAAVALRSPVPLFVAVPLLFAPFSSAALAPSRHARADLAWRAAGMGADVAVDGVLTGPLGASTADLVVDLPNPPGGTASQPLTVERRPDAVRFRTAWRFREPTVTTAQPPTVRWVDPLGLGERTLGGRREPLRLERYPAEVHRLGNLHLERTISMPGETRSHRIGASGEFFGLRFAGPGDPRSRINWRASARAGRLLANEYLAERTGDVLLVLDVRPTSRGSDVDARLLGVACAAAYGIADALVRTKVRVGFASFGEFLDAVPLSTGRGHRARILRAIVTSRLADAPGPAERCALALRRYFRPGVTTIVISSWTDDPIEDLMPYLRRRGFPPLLLSPSPAALHAGTSLLGPEETALAERLERLERGSRLADLWPYGPVVDWENFWSLDGLVRALHEPVRRRVA